MAITYMNFGGMAMDAQDLGQISQNMKTALINTHADVIRDLENWTGDSRDYYNRKIDQWIRDADALIKVGADAAMLIDLEGISGRNTELRAESHFM